MEDDISFLKDRSMENTEKIKVGIVIIRFLRNPILVNYYCKNKIWGVYFHKILLIYGVSMAELIDRFLKIDSFIVPGKVLILYGPRRAGKTTLLKSYLDSCGLRYRLENGDDVRIRNLLGSGDLKQILAFAEGFDLVAIDEAQQIPDIGMGLKILVDHLPALRIIATGSSSFDLAGAIGEPLTGRKRTLTLFPISQMELKQ
ncbi:MAG: AAA family ATPase, partial [Deltaproteobacteria bacterium]|nr:AAA family ATPase [Deltaproteobacteria bacterium]